MPLSESGFERFVCHGNPGKGRTHGPAGRVLVEINWKLKVIRKRCDDCGQWHRLISQEARDDGHHQGSGEGA